MELDYNKCKEVALKFSKKTDFRLENRSEYNFAQKNGFIDEICSHMKSLINIPKKCIYVYEFSDNSVYVGLTSNIKRRNSERKRQLNDSVTKHINETGLEPTLTQLTEYVEYHEAQKLENFYINKYKNENRNILNMVRGGAIGGNIIIWTKENCHNEALKYETKADFRKYSSSAYVTAKNRKWLNDICSHMRPLKQVDGYWNKEKCRETVLNYTDYATFAKENQSCYTAIHRNGWENELCSHILHTKIKPNGYWNYNTCVDAVSQCKTKKEFSNRFQGGYTYARKHGFLQEITKHLEEKAFELTFNEANEICKKYKNVSDLYRNDQKTYKFCHNKNWLIEFFPPEDKSKYTLDYCKEYCKNIPNRHELKDHHTKIYKICKDNDWLDIILPIINLEYYNKPEFKLAYQDLCVNLNSKTEFRDKYTTEYRRCVRYGWIDEFFPSDKFIYNYENCREYCKNFKKRSELHDTNRYLYDICKNNNWLDEFLPKSSTKFK